jgi:WXXGXW repeat (2 copies)
VSVNFAPLALPVYEQPICPQPNLMWTPGYWAYADADYYWVPGEWVPAPYEGALWTPYYWDWYGGRFRLHRGYWGRNVGYYGGVDYGYGYGGIGFSGGDWRGNEFAYNTSVMRVNESVIHTTYTDPASVQRDTIASRNRVSYNGGPGGIQHVATPAEQIADRDQHTAPTSVQAHDEQTAKVDRSSYAKVNGGHPRNVVATKPPVEQAHVAANVPKTEAKPEVRTAPKAEARPETKTTAPKTEVRPEARTAPKVEPQSHAAPAQHAAAQERAAPQQRAAPEQHASVQQRPAPQERAAPQQRAAPQERASTPQERAAPPQRAAPQQHAAPQQRAAPQQHAAQQQRPAPKDESKPKGM